MRKLVTIVAFILASGWIGCHTQKQHIKDTVHTVIIHSCKNVMYTYDPIMNTCQRIWLASQGSTTGVSCDKLTSVYGEFQ